MRNILQGWNNADHFTKNEVGGEDDGAEPPRGEPTDEPRRPVRLELSFACGVASAATIAINIHSAQNVL